VTAKLGRLLAAFGHFWWDFLIGDTPEILVASLVIVGAALALRHHHWAAVIVLPVLAVLTLVVSAWRGRIRRN
jgi:hypothetical protein